MDQRHQGSANLPTDHTPIKNHNAEKKKRPCKIIGGGLRQFSTIVCKKLEAKGRTTYGEVADEIIAEFGGTVKESPASLDEFNEKNVRRRVYDALNVLMALDIITRDKKEIQWKGLPTQDVKGLEELKATRVKLVNRIGKKTAYLNDLKDQEKLKGKELSAREFFVITHKKKDGSWVDSTSENIMEKYDDEITSKFSNDGSTSINEDEIFSQVLGSEKLARLERFGSTRKAAKKEEMERMKEEMKSEMKERLSEVTTYYEAKCDALPAKCEAMQMMFEKVMRQMNCSSSQSHCHSPRSFENDIEDLC